MLKFRSGTIEKNIISDRSASSSRQGRREGGGQGGQLAPGPEQEGGPNLRNILKLNKAPSKSGRVQGVNGCIKRH